MELAYPYKPAEGAMDYEDSYMGAADGTCDTDHSAVRVRCTEGDISDLFG